MIDSINEYFDCIYVLNIERNVDRRINIQEKLNGLRYVFFEGVDGQKLDLEELEQQSIYSSEDTIKNSYNRELMSPNEVACSYSHINIYKDVVEKGFERVLILEDDIEIVLESKADFNNAMSELDPNWDLLYFSHGPNNTKMPFAIWLRIYFIHPFINLFKKQKYSIDELKNSFPKNYSQHLEIAGRHWGSMAYAISSKGAKIILSDLLPISRTADIALGNLCMKRKIKAYSMKKELFGVNLNIQTSINMKAI
ncbi:MAG: glycosyltransferase family 25 protein [Melioribacteraceae bacterium]|nr:glycosyltransferase family 25 protein [Melioribacteraceae bacterium]MCF8262871.1 glycosyltransferase family 25 protein [Melioribacteraceae bacterium]MCF8430901.1 glycosyltransferase family 25 protein [Melioribacteraceae bacterium]